MTAADPHCARLSELTECAYRLGLVFGHEAERAEDTARRLEYFRLFDRCFFSVRVAIALELRLRRTPAMASDEPLAERLDNRADPPEDERADSDRNLERERSEADRDREREAERASLPVLLRTLEGVAEQAATLPGPEPAALPTLRELLAHVAPGSPPAPARTDLRARLAGSAATLTLQRTPTSGNPAGLTVRRATGPPRPA
ncbi:MAG: hypothetical protein ACXWKO_05380 [Phenylobacterium sp.]